MTEVIPHWLDKQADLSPDKTAIETSDGEELTFQQLRDKSRSLAKKMAASGVQEGNHVALLAANSSDMAAAIHALSYLGAVAVLLNVRLSAAELAYQLNDAEVSCLLYDDGHTELALSAVDQADCPDFRSFREIIEQTETTVALQEELVLNKLFTIIYTSGTTGFPKGVEHTYGNHWWSAVSSALNLGLSKNDKWLASLPLFHVGGLSLLVKSVVYGMPVYLMKKFDIDLAHRAIISENVTIVSVVAVMLERLINKLAGGRYPDSFRCMLLGGGPAPEPLLEKARLHEIPVFQTYGMTETSSQIVTLSPDYALSKLGSAGKPLVPAQLKIMLEGNPAPDGTVGEIVVKGPMVTKGYYKNDSANDKSFHDGWLATGDLGKLDEDGFLYVMDRRKDLIISGGENIYPAEIESVLAGMDGVKEAGVIGREDDQWGQVPVVFIVASHTDLTKEKVFDYCRERLAKFKVPKHVYFIAELPRNASNKLVRHKLVDLLGEYES
ncbi:o-succinylbenzoate--CoA ligase [Sediminibacillus halophilus]|uniref:2-succinylbenzoate--CoA ligase n=1 Tax=Sediminibacillus halophilus TaxID=482461 RepID=A0A1G9QNV5_9BACI|nr:o-succinylbenzoate--CoA ligase [Sediminibacillus halophilus]SDM12689.1 O-succinylbenzoic acid--CoA ligase [Sediminibacillus halophilus]